MIVDDPLIEASIIEDAWPMAIGRSLVFRSPEEIEQFKDGNETPFALEPEFCDQFASLCASQGIAQRAVVETLIRSWMAEHAPQTTGV